MKAKVIIKNSHGFVFKNLIQESKLSIVQTLPSVGNNNSVFLISGDECNIDLMREEYKKQTGHVLIWKKT